MNGLRSKINHGAALECEAGDQNVGTVIDNKEWLEIIREPTNAAERVERDAMQRQIEQTARDVGIDDFVDYGKAQTLIPPTLRASSRSHREQRRLSPQQEPAKKRRRTSAAPHDAIGDVEDKLDEIVADRPYRTVQKALSGAEADKIVASKDGRVIYGQTSQSIKARPSVQYEARGSRPIDRPAQQPVLLRQNRNSDQLNSQTIRQSWQQPTQQSPDQPCHEMISPGSRSSQEAVTLRHQEWNHAPIELSHRTVPQTVSHLQYPKSHLATLSPKHTSLHGLTPRSKEPPVRREHYPTLTSSRTWVDTTTDGGRATTTGPHQHRRLNLQTTASENQSPLALWDGPQLPIYLPPPPRMLIEK
ncbi:hypothetical protein AMS68_003174 [Peltaster fructicola]|uniref:Uncharacterized protein n=1 Tax=Peltaster fructicola TaxID=286661 RepID=A0A6H0XSB7_9PEZI|nr:hypothetical protein AMS68_003174 [Peltaster fructicola]